MATDRNLPRHTEDVAARYRQQLEALAERHGELRRTDVRLSLVRGLIFLVGLLVLIAAVTGTISAWWLAPAVLLFLVVAGWHERIVDQLRELAARQSILQLHLHRLARDWQRLPKYAIETQPAWAAVANDLDLTGAGSLFSWLNLAQTPMGRNILRNWLLDRPDAEAIAHRQTMVARLAAATPWRDELLLHGYLLGSDAASPESFLAWATGPGWLRSRPWLIWLARLAVVAVVGLAVAAFAHWLPLSTVLLLLIPLLAINLAISVGYTGTIHEIFGQVSSESDEVRHYCAMLRVAMQLPEHVGPLQLGDDDVRDVARAGLDQLAALRRVLRWINARHDTFLSIIYFVAQLLFLWELHLLNWLEHWQQRSGRGARQWFTAIGELEALTSLATVAYEQPNWAFPQIQPGTSELRGVALGHPLLPDARRVTNDVELGPAGTCLLVTGSNMSGKSTLLRAVGVNVLLANAGGVVCAGELTLPACELGTSMRVHDSLAQGVSFFLAELLRLKDVVDAATRARQEQRTFLFLLDEILQGTNSRERHIAVIEVLGHLLREGAIGAVSTHDLELGEQGELQPALRPVHFRETLTSSDGQRQMSFDYRLHPGLCPTSNALILLELVGLRPESKSS